MLVFIICISIGFQLLLSAIAKFRNFSTFLSIFQSYKFPAIFKNTFFARILILAEALLGVSLLSLNEKIIWFGICGTIFFIFIANVLISIRLVKGEKKFRCGCGETLNEEHNALWLLIRNFALILILFFCLSETISNSFQVSQPTLFIFLTGLGLLSVIKLASAVFKAIFAIKQWKAAG
ncbi:MAG: MauE/DoxX family redox-associated membrane protein [Pyrinomonadaceae bacterium]